MTDSPLDDAPAASRRDLAVARSLDPARARAEKRVQRFLDAATELMSASPDREFTVQEVVERSGVGSSRVDLQACKLEYSIVSPK